MMLDLLQGGLALVIWFAVAAGVALVVGRMVAVRDVKDVPLAVAAAPARSSVVSPTTFFRR